MKRIRKQKIADAKTKIISLLLVAALSVGLWEHVGTAVYAEGDDTAETLSLSDDEESEEEIAATKEVEAVLAAAGVEAIPESVEEYYEAQGISAHDILSLSEFIETYGDAATTGFESSKAASFVKKGGYIRIDSKEELYLWSEKCRSDYTAEKNFYLSASYVLGNNIECEGGSTDAGFYSIGTEDDPFTGCFDGQGFEIRELAIVSKGESSLGMFGCIGEDGVVKNFGICSISELSSNMNNVLVGLIAVVNLGTIQNVYCDITATGNNLNTLNSVANAYFAGLVNSNEGTISNVYFAGNDVTAGNSNGSDPVCLENIGTIENAYYDTTVYSKTVTGVSAEKEEDEADAASVSLDEEEEEESPGLVNSLTDNSLNAADEADEADEDKETLAEADEAEEEALEEVPETADEADGDEADGDDADEDEETKKDAPEEALTEEGEDEADDEADDETKQDTADDEVDEELALLEDTAEIISLGGAAVISDDEEEELLEVLSLEEEEEGSVSVIGLTTIQLKTLGQSDDCAEADMYAASENEEYHWHIIRISVDTSAVASLTATTAKVNTYFDYPKLYGLTSTLSTYTKTDGVYNYLTVSTSADLVYFPTSKEYSAAREYRFVFTITNDIDMSYVADDAYVPNAAASFCGYLTAQTNDGNVYNGSHSIINLRITQAGVYTSGGYSYYYFGLIGRGGSSYIENDEVSGQYCGCISDINFIGGYIDTAGYDLSEGFKQGSFQLYMGMAAGEIYATACSVKNIHSSADVIYADDCIALRTEMGGVFGYIAVASLENITNRGIVTGGTHAYVDEYYSKGSGSYIGGVAGYASITNNITDTELYHIKNIVNYKTVSGIGIYGTMEGGERMQSDATNSGATNYIYRAYSYYVGGVFGRTSDLPILDYLVNFGNVFDVPSVLEEVDVYDTDGSKCGTELRYVGYLPDDASDMYILNYSSQIGGVAGYGGKVSTSNFYSIYGISSASSISEDAEYQDRTYNFGDVTVSESRYCLIGGCIGLGGNSYNAANRKNFGDITCYSLQSYVGGIEGFSNSSSSYGYYDCENYGDIYMDNSSRSGRQTLWTSGSGVHVYGINGAYVYRCENYGDITVSLAGVERSYYSTTMNTSVYPDMNVIGNGYVAVDCINAGNLSVDTFDRWTGEWMYVDLLSEDFFNSASGEQMYDDNAYSVAYTSKRQVRSINVAGNAARTAENCINYGDITVSITPVDYSEIIQTYADLVEALKENCPNRDSDPNNAQYEKMCEAGATTYNGYTSNYTSSGTTIYATGLSSDLYVRKYQLPAGNIYIGGSTLGYSGGVVSNCVNLGNITVNNGVNTYVGGVARHGEASNCVNCGDIDIEGVFGCYVGGVMYEAANLSNCLNCGDITVEGSDSAIYIGGLAVCNKNSVSNTYSACINLGNITAIREGNRIGTDGISTYCGGIIASVSGHYDVKAYGLGNYGNITVDSNVERYVETDDYSKDTVKKLTNYTGTSETDKSADSLYVGGVLGYVYYNTNVSAHSVEVNSCINQGAVDVSCKQMYGTSRLYVGGVIGEAYKAAAKYSGDVLVLTNLVNHGSVSAFFGQESTYTVSDSTKYIAGLIGFLEGNGYNSSYADVETRIIFEYALNTGSVVCEKGDNTSGITMYGGGAIGSLAFGSYNMNNKMVCKNIVSYTDGNLIALYSGITNNYLTTDADGNGTALYNSSGTYLCTTYDNRYIMENLYTAGEEQTVSYGGTSVYDASGNKLAQKSFTIESCSYTNADDENYLYPEYVTDMTVDASEAFFVQGETDSDTGVVCAIGYMAYGGLSDAYRKLYAALNGGTYDDNEVSEPEDDDDGAWSEYYTWYNQPGGFVLSSAKPGSAGSDFLPDQFDASAVDPTGSGCSTWYTDEIQNRILSECKQIQQSDLNELLKLYLTDGSSVTVASRRVTDEETGEKTLYVYVPESMLPATSLTVSSYIISTLSSVSFYSDESRTNDITEGIDDGSYQINDTSSAEEAFTAVLYATVTAESGKSADWTIQIIGVEGEISISVSSALISSSAYASNSGTRIYYEDISDEALESMNFWSYSAYKKGALVSFTIQTKNIPESYNLYNNLTAYYYVQNAYGLTDAALEDENVSNAEYLADLIYDNEAYYMDDAGDIYRKAEGDTKAVLIAELLYNGATYEIIMADEDEDITLKSEKYNCVKDYEDADAADDYYLTNEGTLIRWEFVAASDTDSYLCLTSPNIVGFYGEDNTSLTENESSYAPYCRQQTKSYFNFLAGNVVSVESDADENGDLNGQYTLMSTGMDTYITGGCYALEITMPDTTSVETIYISVDRVDETLFKSTNSFTQTTLGSTATKSLTAQWSESEEVREQLYDGYGAYSSYEAAAAAIEADTDGSVYVATRTYTTYLSGSDSMFDGIFNSSNETLAGFADSSVLRCYAPVSGSDTLQKILFMDINGDYRGAARLLSIYEVHRDENGSVDYMDVIAETVSEDLSQTRFYVVKLIFNTGDVTVSNVKYKEGTSSSVGYSSISTSTLEAYDSDSTTEKTTYTTYEVPKDADDAVSMLITYDTAYLSSPTSSSIFSNSTSYAMAQESFFIIEYCEEGEDTFKTLGNATFSTSGYVYTDKGGGTITINRSSDTALTVVLSKGIAKGYYKVTPVYGRTEYFYLYEDAESFLASVNEGVDEAYAAKIEAVNVASDSGTYAYTVYKTVMYMSYESSVIHMRMNDDSYLKSLYITDESGATNLSSTSGELIWNSDFSATVDGEDEISSDMQSILEAHESVESKENTVNIKTGAITYGADTQKDENDDTLEAVHAFDVYLYIKTAIAQEEVTSAYLQMNESDLPTGSTLYCLADAVYDSESGTWSGSDWIEITFNEDGSLSDESAVYLAYTGFDETGVLKKVYKLVAENKTVSYYTVYVIQNRRDKAITIQVGDIENGKMSSCDSDTEELIAEIAESYGSLGITLRLNVTGDEGTTQTGFYTVSGQDGNEYYSVKYGSYSIILNTPLPDGYVYNVYYYGTDKTTVTSLTQSEDNPNEFYLSMRYGSIAADESLTVCVSIEEEDSSLWGRFKSFVAGLFD